MKIARILLAILALTSLSADVKPTLYLSNFKNDKLSVFDVSNPLTPVLIANPSTTGTSPNAIVMNPQGNALFVANRNSKNFSVFDLTDPQNPVLANLINLALNGGDGPVSIDTNAIGNALYICCTTSQNVLVYDISSPLNPVYAATINLSSPLPALVVNRAQNVLYVAVDQNPNGFVLAFDITNPFVPGVFVSVANSTNFDMRMMLVNPLGTALYVTNGNANTISVFDLTNPLIPLLVNSAISTSGNTALGIAMNFSLGLLYVVNRNSSTIALFNIANAINPLLVGVPVSSVGTSPVGVEPYLQQNVFYVANSGSDNITIFNSNAINIPPPVPVDFADNPDDAGPQDFALFVPPTPPPPPPVVPLLPPSDARVCVQENRFISQSELFVTLSWNPSPSSIATGYRIYRNGELIATVPNDQICYQDHCTCGPAVYAISAIDGTGRESTKTVVKSCI